MEKQKNKLQLLVKIFIAFFKLGSFSFGGGYAMIPLIEREVVEDRKWMGKEKIVDIFAVAQSLPGAIALNASAFVGYYIAGMVGAIVALIANLLPSTLIVLGMSILLAKFGSSAIVESAFRGIRPAIIGLIIYAGYKVAKTAVTDYICLGIMIIAFIASTFFNVSPIPLIVLGAVAGIFIARMPIFKGKFLEHHKEG